MNKKRASYILAASIETQTKENILNLARNLIDKFEKEKPEPGLTMKIELVLNVSTDLLFEIEDHLRMETNGKKKRKRLLKKKYKR